jgi:hypothetical protein
MRLDRRYRTHNANIGIKDNTSRRENNGMMILLYKLGGEATILHKIITAMPLFMFG